MATSQDDFDMRWKEFTLKYYKKHPEIYQYIKKQWVKSRYSKWMIFNNKPGFANTYFAIESF